MKSILPLLIATSCVVSPFTLPAQTPALINTFTNPTPASWDYFGQGMAALGNDRILVAVQNTFTTPTATNVGAVYLLRTNGTLLTTVTNPIPASGPNWNYIGDWFGGAIATLESDRVLIGSPHDSKVYLFSTNGSLVNTLALTNYGYDSFSFGAAVAGVGNDRVLIGAPESNFDHDTYDSYGAAYLYSTNGARLANFNNPTPNQASELGSTVAAFGSDRVLIGASGYNAGAAYLFRTNGTLLMTFTNPAPSAWDYFGHAVAEVGTDRVLVGAYGHDTATTNAGAAYLFNTNGTLLLTFTNPTPAVDDGFGISLAMLGNDRVVIGASGDDTHGTNAGSVYVFDINGALLATINNPKPASDDYFGLRLAAFGNEGVIIGARGHQGVGSAYLFSVPSSVSVPSLTIQLMPSNSVIVSWPSVWTDYVLQQNVDGLSSVNWSNVTDTIYDDGTNRTLLVNPTNGSRFYRLVQP